MFFDNPFQLRHWILVLALAVSMSFLVAIWFRAEFRAVGGAEWWRRASTPASSSWTYGSNKKWTVGAASATMERRNRHSSELSPVLAWCCQVPRISKFKVPNCYLIQAHSSSCRCTTTLAALHLLNSDSQCPLRRTFATSRPRSTIRAPRKRRASLIASFFTFLRERSIIRDRRNGTGQSGREQQRRLCKEFAGAGWRFPWTVRRLSCCCRALKIFAWRSESRHYSCDRVAKLKL